MASIPSNATVKGAIQWAIDPNTNGIIAVAPVTLYEHVMGAPCVVNSTSAAVSEGGGAPFVFLKTGTVSIETSA